MREGKRLVEGVESMAVKPDMDARAFFTPERFAQEQGKRMAPPRGRLLIASCTSATQLASSVVKRYRELLSEWGSEDGILSLYDVDFRFENSETCVRLGRHVGGYDVFLLQSLVDPISGADVDHNYMAFLIAARTFREHGAHHVTAVLPYLAYSRPSGLRWLALGLLCGLAVSTRRMALVLPLTLGLLLVHDLVAALREGTRLPWRRSLALAVGFACGLVPEWIGVALHGDALQPYGESSALSHLKASGGGLRFLVTLQTAGRHIAYLCAVTLGMPMMLALVAVDPGLRRREARPLARTLGFVGYAGLGVVTLTSLHIVRYTFKVGFDRGWHLYPRYVDPLDLALVAVGIAAAAWVLSRGHLADSDARQRLLALVPWLIVAVAVTLAAGPLLRSRGGRLPSMKILEGIGLGPVAPWVFAAFGVLVLGLALWLWRGGRTAGVATVILAATLSWCVSAHSVYFRVLAPSQRDPAPAILRTPALEADPRAPVAVVVGRVGAYSRQYYEPAFRSDHPVWFVRGDEVESWVDEHPEGLVLVLRGDPAPPLRRVARAGGWRAYASPPVEEP